MGDGRGTLKTPGEQGGRFRKEEKLRTERERGDVANNSRNADGKAQGAAHESHD